MNHAAVVFAAVFIGLYIAHSVGDHWVQSSCQAATKGLPGWPGRLACGRHVLGLTLTKVAVLVPLVLVLDLDVTVLGLAVGLGLTPQHFWRTPTTLAAWRRSARGILQLGRHAPATGHG
uniref:PRL2-25 n=1 Tax=Streptomyces sp. 44414 TaxID=364103 RepID=Q1WFE6_9ACTN|nr:pRL2-25 [Streptomyces sp. 44414]